MLWVLCVQATSDALGRYALRIISALIKPLMCLVRTIPHPDRTIATATYESITPKLDTTYKILIHVPTPVGIGWGWHGKSACGRGWGGKW